MWNMPMPKIHFLLFCVFSIASLKLNEAHLEIPVQDDEFEIQPIATQRDEARKPRGFSVTRRHKSHTTEAMSTPDVTIANEMTKNVSESEVTPQPGEFLGFWNKLKNIFHRRDATNEIIEQPHIPKDETEATTNTQQNGNVLRSTSQQVLHPPSQRKRWPELRNKRHRRRGLVIADNLDKDGKTKEVGTNNNRRSQVASTIQVSPGNSTDIKYMTPLHVPKSSINDVTDDVGDKSLVDITSNAPKIFQHEKYIIIKSVRDVFPETENEIAEPKRKKTNLRDTGRKAASLAAIKGSDVTIPCTPKSHKQDRLLDSAVDYIWTNDKGEELFNTRFSENKVGNLKISNLHISDSGKYRCKVNVPTLDNTEIKQHAFEHELLVYELAGHKYTTSLSFKLGNQNESTLNAELYDLLQTVVCDNGNLCEPVNVKTTRCYRRDRKPICEFAINYQALDRVSGKNCDAKCVKREQLGQLEKSKSILEQKLAQYAQDRNSIINPEIRNLETVHLVTCYPGSYIAHSGQQVCYPCKPGTYSGANSIKCSPCDKKYYQEEYGKPACKACPDGKDTDTVGADSIDECVEPTNPFIDTVKNLFFIRA